MRLRGSIIVLAILLTGCEEADIAVGTMKEFGSTASGVVNTAGEQVHDAIDKGKTMTDGVTEMIEDAKKRMNQIQEGVDMMMEGKEMIDSGVSGEDQ